MANHRSDQKPAPAGIQANQPGSIPAASSRADIDSFLNKEKALRPTEGRGRLIFALDATMSRQPTWDQACVLQAQMFRETASIGGLDVQLVYYRGLGECRSSRWVSDPRQLADAVSRN